MQFCNKLRELRLQVGYGFNEFWKDAKISNVYLSALESGVKPPPPPVKQKDFIRLFKKKGAISDEDVSLFYDLAAKERNELPADISLSGKYDEIMKEIRKIIREKN